MFMIGIDPHKGSHTAAAVDRDEAVIDTIRVDADRHQRSRLLAWAARFEPRTWAVEGATGMGALLAQQLVAAGEHVVDVPPKLSSRVRLLERGRIDKTDPNDARSAAIVAWHNPTLNIVVGLDEHRVVLRLLADRDHQITANRTRTICRLHALLCLLIEGGTGTISDRRPKPIICWLRQHRRPDHRGTDRCRTPAARRDPRPRRRPRRGPRTHRDVIVKASATTVTEIHGIGPLTAAIIIGRVGDVRRFPTAGHFARHNGTAPIEASSGPEEAAPA